MEIILKKDITKLGDKDDIVTVKNGYARNYLIPKGLAENATVNAKKIHSEVLKQRAHKEAKYRNDALKFAEKIKDVKLKIGAKTSTKGKIFGSVNSIQIASSLAKKGFEVERKDITIKEELIKEIGIYTASVKLYKDISVDIEFEIVGE